MVRVLEPIQERRAGYEANPRKVDEILEDGKNRATTRAEQTMVEVRAAVGIG